MLGFILIYFIGKQFYDLAIEHNRNEWVYAISGVVSYYVGTFLGGIIIGLGALLMDSDINKMNETALSLFCVPFGLAFCGLIYYLWRSKITKPPKTDFNILDDGL